MTRSLILLFAITLVTLTAFGQSRHRNEDNSLKGVPFKDRIVTGGGIGMSFSKNQDFISLSPIIGYAFTKKFVGGTGFTYTYTKYKDVYPGKDATTSSYGINPFMRYTVFHGIFLQTEYEYLNYEAILIPSLDTQRDNFGSFMAGGGIVQPLGERSGIFFMILYNFSFREAGQNEYLPYASPWVFRVGFNVGALSF